jgi:hypothetical protein
MAWLAHTSGVQPAEFGRLQPWETALLAQKIGELEKQDNDMQAEYVRILLGHMTECTKAIVGTLANVMRAMAARSV